MAKHEKDTAPAPAVTGPKPKAAYEGKDTVTISLDRARDVKGTAYGPGKDIRVPKDVADVLNAENAQTAKGVKQGKGRK